MKSVHSLLVVAFMIATALIVGPISLVSLRAAEPVRPALSLTTLAGEDFDLGRQRGHVVVVYFWATWCPGCADEMPQLQSFFEHYRERGVEVIAVSEDRAQDIDAVHQVMRQMRMTYPVALSHTVSRNTFGPQATLPVTYVIDAQGVLRAELRPKTQAVSEAVLAKLVGPLLAAAGP